MFEYRIDTAEMNFGIFIVGLISSNKTNLVIDG